EIDQAVLACLGGGPEAQAPCHCAGHRLALRLLGVGLPRGGHLPAEPGPELLVPGRPFANQLDRDRPPSGPTPSRTPIAPRPSSAMVRRSEDRRTTRAAWGLHVRAIRRGFGRPRTKSSTRIDPRCLPLARNCFGHPSTVDRACGRYRSTTP